MEIWTNFIINLFSVYIYIYIYIYIVEHPHQSSPMSQLGGGSVHNI
jgi:hypothetical protein